MVDHIKPGSQAASIRGKRRASGVDRIAAKVAAGEPHAKRAYVQLGKANTRIITGQEDLSEWDDEELKRGQRRDKNGRFQGVAPKIVPKVIHDELVRRTLSRANQKLMENTEAAVEALIDVIKGADTDEKARVKAIDMLLARTMGKPADKLEVTGDTPAWQLAIGTAIVSIKSSDILGDDDEEGELNG